MIEVMTRAALAWLGLVILLRFAGRRTLGEMTPVDLVVLLITSGIVQQSLLAEDRSLTSGFLVIITLLLLSILYALLKSRFPGVARRLEGVPTVLVREGVQDAAQLRASRVSMEEVLQAARQNGVTEPTDIRFAILEISGAISIIPKATKQDS